MGRAGRKGGAKGEGNIKSGGKSGRGRGQRGRERR